MFEFMGRVTSAYAELSSRLLQCRSLMDVWREQARFAQRILNAAQVATPPDHAKPKKKRKRSLAPSLRSPVNKASECEPSKPVRKGLRRVSPVGCGVELIERLKVEGHQLPAIMITGSGAVPMAVQAMKAGAVDFIEKPVGHADLLASVERALEHTRDTAALSARREKAALSVGSLTTRQRQILELVLAGHPSKNIAADLGISQRTVDNHRAAIMRKTGSKSLPALVRTALAAA
jgi:FixJ family two-component response regulator